jgi:hypothetical protein
MKTTEKIALEFSKELLKELGKEEFKEMVELSRENTDPKICVSHDFCDANMPMLEAYERVTKYEPQANNDAHNKIWSDAWNVAVKNDFFIEIFDLPILDYKSSFEDVKKYIKWLSNSKDYCYHIDDSVKDTFEISKPSYVVDILVKNEQIMWSFATDPKGKNLWEHYDLKFDEFGNTIENF